MGNKSNYKYSFSQLRKDVVLDIEAYLGFASEYNSNERNWRSNLSALLMPSVIACWIYRYSHWFYSHGFSRISLIISGLNQFLLGVSITPASRIQGGLYIAHPASGIVFQGDAGMRLKLLAGSAVTAEPMMPLHRHGHSKSPHFGDDVALGSKAFVCGSVTVGSNTRIGFNAVIFEDIPENSLVISTYVRNRIEKNNV